MHNRYRREGGDSMDLFRSTSRPHPLNATTAPGLFRGGIKL